MPEHAVYLSHYGLREEPFGERIDLRLLYRSTSFEQTMTSLVSGITRGHYYQAVVGPPGVGKSITLHALMEHFRETAYATVVFRRGGKFLATLTDQLGLDAKATAAQRREVLSNILRGETSKGRLLILGIDEAQNLTHSALQ